MLVLPTSNAMIVDRNMTVSIAIRNIVILVRWKSFADNKSINIPVKDTIIPDPYANEK